MEDKLVSELREQANGDRLLAEASADEIERLNAIIDEIEEGREKAADEIERLRIDNAAYDEQLSALHVERANLRADNTRLRAALEHLCNYVEVQAQQMPSPPTSLKAARAALNGGRDE